MIGLHDGFHFCISAFLHSCVPRSRLPSPTLPSDLAEAVKKCGGVWLHNDVVLRLQVDDDPDAAGVDQGKLEALDKALGKKVLMQHDILTPKFQVMESARERISPA